MDLSTGKRIDDTREAILAPATVAIGKVPIYQALERVKRPEDLSADLLLEVIEHQAGQGVDYMTIPRERAPGASAGVPASGHGHNL
jgi:phosphomethylpyrimidine synthase